MGLSERFFYTVFFDTSGYFLKYQIIDVTEAKSQMGTDLTGLPLGLASRPVWSIFWLKC